MGDVDDVLAANRVFYEAFEARDLDAMSDAWEHSDRVSCTHPGWPLLRGWAAVSSSWVALFQGPQHMQFILTEDHVELVGDAAWVTVDENILDEGSGATVSALNLFVRSEKGWLMVAYQGSGVLPRA